MWYSGSIKALTHKTSYTGGTLQQTKKERDQEREREREREGEREKRGVVVLFRRGVAGFGAQ